MAKRKKVEKHKESLYEKMARASSRHARVHHKAERKVQKPSKCVAVVLSDEEKGQLLQSIAAKVNPIVFISA